MIDVFFLKQRTDDVTLAAFRDYMSEERLPTLLTIPEIEAYELWFPAEDDPIDSIERLSFADRDAMRRAFDSSTAADLHDTGSEYIDFDAEEFIVTDPVHRSAD